MHCKLTLNFCCDFAMFLSSFCKVVGTLLPRYYREATVNWLSVSEAYFPRDLTCQIYIHLLHKMLSNFEWIQFNPLESFRLSVKQKNSFSIGCHDGDYSFSSFNFSTTTCLRKHIRLNAINKKSPIDHG